MSKHPLQSDAWADFRKKWGNEIVKTEFGYLTLHKVPLVPYRVAIFEKGPKPTPQMLARLKEVGRRHRAIFVKLEPNVEKDASTPKILRDSGAVPGKTLFTPTTFQIDLTRSEGELLQSFSAKTRYNIRLAERRGVVVSEDNSDKAFAQYLKLTRQTVARQGFYAHTQHYHRLMWETMRAAGIAHLLITTYQGEIITTWILFVYDNFLYYPYGASSEKYKNVMANNLMMWEAIKFGKRMGCQTFDLWGREEGKGFTRFKEGYNPKVVEFLGTWDLILNQPLYYLYRIFEALRWIILRCKSKLVKPTF